MPLITVSDTILLQFTASELLDVDGFFQIVPLPTLTWSGTGAPNEDGVYEFTAIVTEDFEGEIFPLAVKDLAGNVGFIEGTTDGSSVNIGKLLD
jgi:hypothetical protein